MGDLRNFLTRDDERALFGLPPLPETAQNIQAIRTTAGGGHENVTILLHEVALRLSPSIL